MSRVFNLARHLLSKAKGLNWSDKGHSSTPNPVYSGDFTIDSSINQSTSLEWDNEITIDPNASKELSFNLKGNPVHYLEVANHSNPVIQITPALEEEFSSVSRAGPEIAPSDSN